MGTSTRASLHHLGLVMVLVLLLFAPAVLADEPAPTVAKVTVDGPHEVTLAPEQETPFWLHLRSRLECGRGMEPPLALVVNVSGTDDEAHYQVDPERVQVPWTAVPDEADVYEIDTVVSFNATSHMTPEAPTEEDALLVVREVEEVRPKLHCRVEGYDLEYDAHAFSFVLVPEGEEAGAAMDREDPPVQWMPLLLAVSILGALGVFATWRERRRRDA